MVIERALRAEWMQRYGHAVHRRITERQYDHTLLKRMQNNTMI